MQKKIFPPQFKGKQLKTVIFGLAVLLLIGLTTLILTNWWRVSSLEQRIEQQFAGERSEESENSRSDVEMFENAVGGLEELLEGRNRETAVQWFEKLISTDSKVSLVEGTGLEFRNEGELHGSLWTEGRRCFSIDGEPARGTVRIASSLENTLRTAPGESRAREFIIAERDKLDKIISTEKRMKGQLEQLLEDQELSAVLDSRDLRPTRIVLDEFILRLGFTNPNGVVIVRAAADAEQGEYRIDGKPFKNDEQFAEGLLEALQDYDPVEELRRAREALQERLQKLLKDEGFRGYAEDRGLSFHREDADEIRLKSEDGDVVAILSVRPEQGEIVLEAPNSEDTWRLYQSKPSVAEKEVVRFLLLGKNDALTDTIMLVQASPEMISMVSVPRDIYFEGQKINQLYTAKGPAALLDVVSRITGVPIDHYVTVDTEGFADIVDALGTINVELETELLDPSMYYRKGDEWRMLYFSAGEQELNGSAALALARSRNTSSDFGRAARQQLLIAGIRERFEQLSLTKAGRLYELVSTALEYSETDISVLQGIHYFRQYRNVAQLRRMVLSTDNVFYSTYSGLHHRGLELKEATRFTDEELGAWILRPIDEDWSLVTRYTEDWLAGKQPKVEDYR